MKGWPQAIGAGLGYVAGGPVGALLGYVAGRRLAPASPAEEGSVLIACLLGFIGVLLGGHGIPAVEDRRSAVRFVSRLFRFDVEDERLTRRLLDQLLAVDLDIGAVARTFRRHSEPPMRRQLLEILFTVCRLYGPLESHHLESLFRIAAGLDIEQGQWQILTARYLPRSPALDTDCCYALLGLYPGSPLAEVKAAYRSLAKRYHPDRSAHLNPASRQRSAEMMTLINAAYDILRSRGRP